MIIDVISVTILFFGIVIVLKTVYDFKGAINSTPSIYDHDFRRKLFATSFNDILIGLIYFIIGMLLFLRIVSVEIAFGLLVGISIIDKAKNYMKK